ncbi:MAG: DEAD/DEAH box helicase [Candidatus Woesearchaeota archaeon]|nr:MAG: DEAD/DEAH box helicase [Candidatus Woesearchaeota archaeon]
MLFEDFDLREEIVAALKDDGITTPTQIQEEAIPHILDGEDVIGISKTGSGKTVTFAVPMLDFIKKGEGLQVMVLVPTRELAVQIAGEFTKFAKYLGFKVATIYGGVGMEPQIKAMKKAEILVGTPGRTLDHLERKNLDLSRITCVAVDEADKMVDMGFIEDVSRIIGETPDNRQMLLFGATIAQEVEQLQHKFMHEPVVVKAEQSVSANLLEQYYYALRTNEKFSMLVHLLSKKDFGRTIIFCSARTTVEMLTKNLKKQGFEVSMIHGKLTQSKRLEVMKQYNEGDVQILVASAVAARGLHIGDISHVINYDLSNDPEEYVHRVGRTARAGEKGVAITLLCERDYDTFGQILQRFDVTIKELPKEPFQRVSFDTGRPQSRGTGPRGRPSQGRFGDRRSSSSRDSAPRSGPRREGSRQGISSHRGSGVSRERFSDREGTRSSSRSGERSSSPRRSFSRPSSERRSHSQSA